MGKGAKGKVAKGKGKRDIGGKRKGANGDAKEREKKTTRVTANKPERRKLRRLIRMHDKDEESPCC